MINPYFGVIIYCLITYLFGYLIYLLVLPKKINSYNLFLTLGLSWGLGNGLLIVILVTLLFINRLYWLNFNFFFVTTIGILVSLLTAFFFLKKTRRISFSLSPVNLGLLILILVIFFPLIKHSLWTPPNAWDALAIWMLKAKVLLSNSSILENPFFRDSYYWFTHQDYPLGIPLIINAYYRTINFVHDQAIQLYLLQYYIGLIFLLIGSLRYFLAKKLSLTLQVITIVLIITMPSFAIYSHNGFADIPLSYFFVAALFLLLDYLKTNDNDLVVPAVFLSLISAVIKIEGYTYSFFFISIFGVLYLIKTQINSLKPQLIIKLGTSLFFGSLPILIWGILKHKMQIGSTFSILVLNPNLFSALKTILHTYFNQLINTSQFSLSLIVAFIIYLPQITNLIFLKRFPQIMANLVPVLQLGAYTILYLVTPNPLLFQLDSFGRLILHLIPLIYILIFYNFDFIWINKGKKN